jgi:hypothetical protein
MVRLLAKIVTVIAIYSIALQTLLRAICTLRMPALIPSL